MLVLGDRVDVGPYYVQHHCNHRRGFVTFIRSLRAGRKPIEREACPVAVC